LAAAGTTKIELPHDTISIADEPAYPWRSLMIDTGRRLFPMPLVRSIIDAMAMAKLNVLQLHMNDMGRFAWESKVFPELNVGYDTDTRYWKQDEIKDLITYARDRGVRLVPEIEMSTHAKALFPLVKTQGLTFCNLSFPVMLFDDPAGNTFAALKKLVSEMAGLFPDSVLHVGMDEAQCHYSEQSSKDPLDVGMCGLQNPPRCNQDTVRELQHKLLSWVSSELASHRTPMAWHNAYTDCGDLNGCGKPGAPPAATQGVPSTIVQVFAGSSIGETALTASELLSNVTKAGYRAVMTDAGRLYLDTGSTNPADYRNLLWDDIGMGLSPAQLPLVLGGSMPLWSDNYCSGTVECGGWAYCPGAPWPAGAPFPTGRPGATCTSSLGWMQSSAQDAAFILSAGGLLFPRANFGAGAFWNYRYDIFHLCFTGQLSSTDGVNLTDMLFRHDVATDSAEMLRRTDALAASMKERGVLGVCEPGCSCSFGSRCGVAYKPSS
jgi:hexosaminidase